MPLPTPNLELRTSNFALPHALIFDWDNTLVASWGAIADAINATLAHFGKPAWTMDQVHANCTRSARESFPDWFGDRAAEATEIFYARFKQAQMQSLSPLPGARALLEWLRTQKIPCVVVSNKNGGYLREEAKALGWNKYFAAIVGAADAPRDKPSRDHADHALRLAGLQAGRAIWFVGDSEADIQCARNAGCLSILIGHKNPVPNWGADMSVTDCAALQGLLCDRLRAIGDKD